MSKIRQIEVFYVSIPMPALFYPAWIPGYPQKDSSFAVIRVLTEDGIEGFSTAPVFGKEHKVVTQLIGPSLMGEDATNIPAILQRIREVAYLGFRNYWIEPAFWDIKGKKEGKPLCELLGGRPVKVKLCAQSVDMKNSTERIKELESLYENGFRSVKIKVHHLDEKQDVEQIVGTAKAMQGKMNLHVDANQGWRMDMFSKAPLWDLDRAKRFSDVCANAGLLSLEEPLPMDEYDDLCELTKYSRIPIAGGEMHSSGFPEIKMMIERKCYSVFTPDVITSGGVLQVWKMIELIKKHNLRYSAHSFLNGISFAANLQVIAASGFAETEELAYPFAPPAWTTDVNDRILEEPFNIVNGYVDTPALPGLGIRVNKKVLRKHGTRIGIMNANRRVVFSLQNYGIKSSLIMDKAIKERRESFQ